ncbi:hypothetical protein [Methylobacterium sp. WL8]|uniref:hypothetical protein n=1 Tax=Methylobacterium sp. WL8 TaxID=2603899 RepID=UPI0011C81C12|nr:hypothetical protein [Methylobacterium sp. WL8]TXN82807.1 hypothetical protein FV234_08965 [Methylobacterium sp. WL8]
MFGSVTGVSPETGAGASGVGRAVAIMAAALADAVATGSGMAAAAIRWVACGGTGAGVAAAALPTPSRKRNPRASAIEGVAASAQAADAAKAIHPICEILRIRASIDRASLPRSAFTKAQETESTHPAPSTGRTA